MTIVELVRNIAFICIGGLTAFAFVFWLLAMSKNWTSRCYDPSMDRWTMMDTLWSVIIFGGLLYAALYCIWWQIGAYLHTLPG
jgi:hypothetical protein